jgi:hypothetical protein
MNYKWYCTNAQLKATTYFIILVHFALYILDSFLGTDLLSRFVHLTGSDRLN